MELQTKSFTIWFTGITRSGKSTLAKRLQDRLTGMGLHAELLDSGQIRRELNRDLGFTPEEIEKALKRIAYECQLLNRNGIIAIVSAVSPYREMRDRIRCEIPLFVEVYCETTTEVARRRDTTGLFDKAIAGDIKHVAGINAPYEPPDNPEVQVRTDRHSIDDCLNQILKCLQNLKYIPHDVDAGYTPEEAEMIKQRLKGTGYI